MNHVAVLMTTYNRRDTTLRCLRSLFDGANRAPFTVYLVDDHSSDGTAEAIRETFPSVEIHQGTGSLFWGGGMRAARQIAHGNSNYYLWLNDDVVLRKGALDHLLQTSQDLESLCDRPPIVVGAFSDPVAGGTSYSGVRRTSRWRPLSFARVDPAADPVRCATFNGNMVLIPRTVDDDLGGMRAFTQQMGDFDYGLRATARGHGTWVAAGYVGTCARNESRGTWSDRSLSLKSRWALTRSMKGLPPREWATFCRSHAGPMWLVYFVSPYARVIGGSVRDSIGRRRRTSHVST